MAGMNRRGFLTSAMAAAGGMLVPEWILDPLKGRSMISVPAIDVAPFYGGGFIVPPDFMDYVIVPYQRAIRVRGVSSPVLYSNVENGVDWIVETTLGDTPPPSGPFVYEVSN